jgi:hypothetical protein
LNAASTSTLPTSTFKICFDHICTWSMFINYKLLCKCAGAWLLCAKYYLYFGWNSGFISLKHLVGCSTCTNTFMLKSLNMSMVPKVKKIDVNFCYLFPKKVSKKNNRIVKHDNMNCGTRIEYLDSQKESWPMWCHLWRIIHKKTLNIIIITLQTITPI